MKDLLLENLSKIFIVQYVIDYCLYYILYIVKCEKLVLTKVIIPSLLKYPYSTNYVE